MVIFGKIWQLEENDSRKERLFKAKPRFSAISFFTACTMINKSKKV